MSSSIGSLGLRVGLESGFNRTDAGDAGGVVAAQQVGHADELGAVQAQVLRHVGRAVLLHVLLVVEHVPASWQNFDQD